MNADSDSAGNSCSMSIHHTAKRMPSEEILALFIQISKPFSRIPEISVDCALIGRLNSTNKEEDYPHETLS